MRAILHDSSLLCSVLFSAVAIAFAVQIDYGDVNDNLVPLACVAISLAAAAAELLNRAKGGVDWSVTGGLGLTLFAGYLALIRTVGFLPATPVFVAAVFFFSRRRQARALAGGLLFGIVLAAVVYAVFVTGMGNLLPEGMFE